MTYPNKFIFADFEYGKSTERFPTLIWGSFHLDGSLFDFDLRFEEGRQKLREWIVPYKDRALVSYALDAEIRSFHSLFQDTVNPFQYGVCLRREHLLLANHCRYLTSGEVISKSSKIKSKFTPAQRKEAKTKYINLLNALWKFLGIFDKEHCAYKDVLRDVCIRANPEELEQNIISIGRYCGMDVQHLPMLMAAMMHELEKRQGFLNWEQIFFRGHYASNIARKTTRGYYIATDQLANLCANKGRIIGSIREHIIQHFPRLPTFRRKSPKLPYTYNEDAVREYIMHQAPSKIRRAFGRTAKGKISVSKDVFEQLFPNRHALVDDDYLQQIYRYKYTSNSLRGITYEKRTKDSETKKLGDFMGSDGIVRPYFGDYSSQSSRSQPSANGYLLLKPAWTRTLLKPPPGHAMVISDYGKQEVLIAALLSGDKNLLEAYASGDPYTHDGLKTGVLKEDMRGSVEWDVKRHMLKQKILSTLYRITKFGLALQLSTIARRDVSELEAQRHIDTFNRSYPDVGRYFARQVLKYKRDKRIVLSDGWTMWGDNYNERSIQNVEIQGTGAVAMRYADTLLEQTGLWVAMTLHDAFYVYTPLLPDGTVDLNALAAMVREMRKGFGMAVGWRPGWELITQDFAVVYPGAAEKNLHPKIEVEGRAYEIEYKDKYVDKRATQDIERYQQFMEPSFNTGTQKRS